MATPPRYSHISVAIPLLAEKQNLLPLLSRFRCQTFSNFTLYLCVNNVEKGYGYEENQESLHLLRSISDLPLSIIDRSSHGLGWTGKRKGVGWARKLLFDRISNEHDGNELIISLDADTDFDNNYLEAVLHTMNTFPSANAFAVPYYHPLSGIETLDRPMLRYECYMRHYLINLLLINNPYAFSALGSAIAFPLWAYRRVGGITPLQGGEDFYLLQKFAKTGTIRQLFSPYSSITVRPQGRASSRVPFGTGPAIASGLDEMDLRYPFYLPEAFQAVHDTYNAFPALFHHDIETPMSSFLRQQLGTSDLWSPLRRNFHSPDLFIHACTERVDGLRILQFLKNNPSYRMSPSQLPVDFRRDSIETLNSYRDQLFHQEMELKQKNQTHSIQ